MITVGINKVDTYKKTSKHKRTEVVKLADKMAKLDTTDWMYVMPKENYWVVRKSGSDRASGRFSNKQSAVNAARRVVQNTGHGRIIIHNSTGEVIRVIQNEF